MSTSNLPPIPESRPVPPLPARPSDGPSRKPSATSAHQPHPFIQRHPIYARFVIALEWLAGLLVAVGFIAGFREWWNWFPDGIATSGRFFLASQLGFQVGAVAFAAGASVLFAWLGLACIVMTASMVGRLLLSIEGLLTRNDEPRGKSR